MDELPGAAPTRGRSVVTSVLLKTTVEVGGGANVIATRGFALQDVKSNHDPELVGPWGLEPQTSTAPR